MDSYKSLKNSVIFGTTLVRTITFICIPYIVIKLTNSGINPAITGLILGFGWLFGILGGYIVGYLSDAIGRKKVLTVTLIFWSTVFLIFIFNKSLFMMFLLNIINGLCRAFHDPITQSIISDSTDDSTERKKLFYKRYVAANIGGAIGPLIGGFVSEDYINVVFFISFVLIFMYGIINIFIQYPLINNKKDNTSFKGSLNIIQKDKELIIITTGALFIAVGVAMIDLIPNLLKFHDIPTNKFSYLLTVNAITVILLNKFITNLSNKIKEKTFMYLGCFLFILGLMMISITGNFSIMLMGIFVFTLGEIIVLPTNSIMIDNIAPKQLVGSYYGAYNFRTLGNFLTPITLGLCITLIDTNIAFIIFTLISGISFFLFRMYFNRLIFTSKNIN